MTNNLLDLTEFDSLSNSSSGPILQLTSNLANEDTLNSNLNPAAIPFTPMANTYMPTAANANVNPFQDSFMNNKPQDNSQVPGTFVRITIAIYLSYVCMYTMYNVDVLYNHATVL